MGILYLVATPIGNLKDITFRAIETLKNSDVILCEDTRKSGLLLKQYEIPPKRLISYFEYNELQRIPEVIALLKDGLNISLVSSAGTPTISDPGFKLVRECIKEGIRVESIPGPSSILAALTASGLPTDKFFFLGFLPKSQGKKTTLLKDASEVKKRIKTTLIFFESPYRLVDTLNDIADVFGDVAVVVARELTKMHEEIRRGSSKELAEYYIKSGVKGEIVVLI